MGNGGIAEFRLDRLTDYSEAAILSELARVAGLVEGRALTIAQFRRHARVSYPAVWRRFRGWKEALHSAGLGHRYSGQSVAGRMRGKRPARGMSDREILDAVRAHALKLGRDRLKMDDFKHHPFLSAATLWRRFGRWRQAMERAGLKTGRYAGPWSEDECFENLRAVWVRLGRAPTAGEMSRPPSRIGAGPYVRRWGRWRLALLAFAERANRELRAVGPDGTAAKANGGANGKADGIRAGETLARAPGRPDVGIRFDAAGTRPESVELKSAEPHAAGTESAGTDPAADSAADSAAARAATIAAAQGPRHVPVSLRFKIMQRDGFRCTACGNSPAIERGCRLEIDHVVPWSRGGATHPANLRTLCSVCNQGKGDSIEENPLPPG